MKISTTVVAIYVHIYVCVYIITLFICMYILYVYALYVTEC